LLARANRTRADAVFGGSTVTAIGFMLLASAAALLLAGNLIISAMVR
jgi:hypothetical protein